VDAYRLKLLLPLTEEQEALLRLKDQQPGVSLDAVSGSELVVSAQP
jgi:hypothetical protein